eukprot:6290463-Prymnesium_polylepis.1
MVRGERLTMGDLGDGRSWRWKLVLPCSRSSGTNRSAPPTWRAAPSSSRTVACGSGRPQTVGRQGSSPAAGGARAHGRWAGPGGWRRAAGARAVGWAGPGGVPAGHHARHDARRHAHLRVPSLPGVGEVAHAPRERRRVGAHVAIGLGAAVVRARVGAGRATAAMCGAGPLP